MAKKNDRKSNLQSKDVIKKRQPINNTKSYKLEV